MTSNTDQTESVRLRKRRKAGRKRRNALENHGTTLSQDELFALKKDK